MFGFFIDVGGSSQTVAESAEAAEAAAEAAAAAAAAGRSAVRPSTSPLFLHRHCVQRTANANVTRAGMYAAECRAVRTRVAADLQ
jgi:zona occludens toxin (predicted ATPase)